MASDWVIRFTLVDTLGLKTNLSYKYHSDQIALADGFGEANTVMEDLKTDLTAVTDANFYSWSLNYLAGGSPALPADADITDVALVTTYLVGAGVLPKYAIVRIPAPVSGIFGADGKTIDKTDADLITYVADFAAGGVQVSDGEHVVVDIDNGIKGGSWTSAKKTSKSVQAS